MVWVLAGIAVSWVLAVVAVLALLVAAIRISSQSNDHMELYPDHD